MSANSSNSSTHHPVFSMLIGASYSVFGVGGLVFNIVVTAAIYRCGLLSRGASSVFILAACTVADGVIRLSFFAFYYGPSIMMGRHLGDEGPFGPISYHITLIMFASWSMGAISELLIAINRLLTIKRVVVDSVYSGNEEGVLPFTRFNCLLYSACVYPVMLASQYMWMWITPCCKPYFVQDYYAIIFAVPEGGYNYFFSLIVRPISNLCLVVSVTSYIIIFVMISRAHAKSAARLGNVNPAIMARRRQEQCSSLQFAVAYVFWVVLWIMFELLPYLPSDPPYWFSMEVFAAILDCSTNTLVQAFLNSTVRNELVRMYRMLKVCHFAGFRASSAPGRRFGRAAGRSTSSDDYSVRTQSTSKRRLLMRNSTQRMLEIDGDAIAATAKN